MTADVELIGQVVANVLGLAMLCIGLRSQVRQGEIYLRTMKELVAATRARCHDDRDDGSKPAAGDLEVSHRSG